jgi:hypothetical protein
MSANGGDLQGHGPKLHDACEDAWKKRGKDGPTEYVVAEIRVTGNNPITGYTVKLRPA